MNTTPNGRWLPFSGRRLNAIGLCFACGGCAITVVNLDQVSQARRVLAIRWAAENIHTEVEIFGRGEN